MKLSKGNYAYERIEDTRYYVFEDRSTVCYEFSSETITRQCAVVYYSTCKFD